MLGDTVRYERRGAAAVVTIDRPDVVNCVDPTTAGALGAAVDRFVEGDARVLVLTGAGGRFSSGADLKAWKEVLEAGDGPRFVADDGPLGFTRRTDVDKPTVAAIEGVCYAGAVEMAAWCDLRIAGESTGFGCLERRWNIPLIDGGTQRLPRIVGLGNALDLMLTGRRFDTAEAHRIGFVQRVVPDGQALETALEVAERIAGSPWDAVLADRNATYEGLGRPLEEGLEIEAAEGAMFEDPDVVERTVERLEAFAKGER